MGFLGRLFGSGKAARSDSGSSMSLASSLMQQKESLEAGKCDICGATYVSCEAQVVILSPRTPFMRLDIGGYCPRCHKACCQRHLAYSHATASHLPDAGRFRDSTWGIVCENCGTQVRHDRQNAPGRFVTIVALEAKDLAPEAEDPGPRKTRPSAAFAAPSGKFSMQKMLEAMLKPTDPDLDSVPQMICTICFALHPHPVPARLFGLTDLRRSGQDMGPGDFEIDIGGTCPTCGVICGKHATLREISVQGQPAIALFCATHNEQLE